MFIDPSAAQIELHWHDQNHAEGTILNNFKSKQTTPPQKNPKNLKGILILNTYLIFLLLLSLAEINFYGISFPLSIVRCTEMLFGALLLNERSQDGDTGKGSDMYCELPCVSVLNYLKKSNCGYNYLLCLKKPLPSTYCSSRLLPPNAHDLLCLYNMTPRSGGQSQVSSECHTIVLPGNKYCLSIVMVWVGRWVNEGKK